MTQLDACSEISNNEALLSLFKTLCQPRAHLCAHIKACTLSDFMLTPNIGGIKLVGCPHSAWSSKSSFHLLHPQLRMLGGGICLHAWCEMEYTDIPIQAFADFDLLEFFFLHNYSYRLQCLFVYLFICFLMYSFEYDDYLISFLDDSEVVAMYHSLKADYKKLEHDFLTMTRIAGLVSTLNCEYQVCCLLVAWSQASYSTYVIDCARVLLLTCIPTKSATCPIC